MGRPSIASAQSLHGTWARPLDRYSYLLALQETPFWRDLYASWQSDEIEQWAHRYAVVDGWLIDVCKDTLRSWASDPDSAHDPQPFVYVIEGVGTTPQLVQELRAVASSGGLLTAATVKYVRSMNTDQTSILRSWPLRCACSWTARYQTGATYSEIADIGGLDNYADAISTVSHAVRRFARRIDLTLRASGSSCSLLP